MAASLRRLEASLGSYLLVVCVGGDEAPRDLYQSEAWSQSYPLIWRWADREGYQRRTFWETSHEIFRQPARGRFVVCADADVIFVREFSKLLAELSAKPAVAGVIAHGPPLVVPEILQVWKQLFRDYDVPEAEPIYQHPGWGFMTRQQMTPMYLNFGMVVMNAALLEAISSEMEAADTFVQERLETFFRFQIALTLVIQKLGLPARALPLRYNYPNNPKFDERFPEELQELRVLHYLRREIVQRERDFATLEQVRLLTERTDLVGSNEVLRQIVAELYPIVAAEEAS